jgi:hypothetical protein
MIGKQKEKKMRNRLIQALGLAVLIPLAASCSHSQLPGSPVPAVFTDIQAARLADSYLAQHNTPPLALHSAQQLDDGYLLSYQSMFDPAATPPKESRLVVVNFDGTVRELSFKKGR